MTYPIHPACAEWPRPSDAVVQGMAASIKAKGLLDAISLTRDGEILDGKTRYEACQIAGVEPRFETYTGALTPEEFSITKNAERRQMEPGPLSLIVAALHNVQHGGDRGNQHTGGKVHACPLPDKSKTLDRLADAAKVGRTTVVKAKVLLACGEPNIIKMVRNKEVGVVNAALYAKNTPREEQRSATAKTVKKNGGALRKPNECADKNTIAIPVEDVIDKLRPLIKRVKEQSDRHAATVSFMALRIIAHELKQLADSWMKNGPESGTHSEPVPLNCVRKGG